MAEIVRIKGNDFYVYELGTNFKSVAGVYVFLQPGQGGWYVRYVGETENFKRRLSTGLETHQAYECAVEKGGSTHIALRIVASGRKARLALEKALRAHFDPPCNAR